VRADRGASPVRTMRPTPARRAVANVLAAMTLTGALPDLAASAETRSTLDGVISSYEYSNVHIIEDGVFEVA
jgi:hypothetical protein